MVALALWMELNGAVDASRRDRWGKKGELVNIYIINCCFYSRIPPLDRSLSTNRKCMMPLLIDNAHPSARRQRIDACLRRTTTCIW